MKPQIIADIAFVDAERKIQPSQTYQVDFDAGTVRGGLDGLEALKQSIFLRLITVLGIHEIYSDAYGLPMNDLLGQSVPKIYVSITNAIRKTLLEDDRILEVGDFVYNTTKKAVDTVFGQTAFREVSLNV